MLALKPQQIHVRGRLGLIVAIEEWENGGAIEISCAGITDRLVFNGAGALLHIGQRVDTPAPEKEGLPSGQETPKEKPAHAANG